MTPEDLALRNAAARYLGEIQTLRKAVVRQKMELDRLRHELTGTRLHRVTTALDLLTRAQYMARKEEEK